MFAQLAEEGCKMLDYMTSQIYIKIKCNKEVSGMKKAVGYARVSTDDQAREGVSLENQREKIRAYALLKDLELVEIVEDAGLSAKNLRRPGMQRVLDLAKRHEIDAVVVYKLDRAFRSTVDALEVTSRLDRQGIEFHSLQESLDTSSAMGRFFFTLTAALAEMERGIVSERTTHALQHIRNTGRKTGGDVPLGFDLNEAGELIENREEQEIINLIKSLRSNGHSYRAIARNLEEHGYKTKRGNAVWHPQTIKQILRAAA